MPSPKPALQPPSTSEIKSSLQAERSAPTSVHSSVRSPVQSGSSLLCRLQSLFLSQAGGRWVEAAPHGQGSALRSFPLSRQAPGAPTITPSLSWDAPLWSLSGKSPAHGRGRQDHPH